MKKLSRVFALLFTFFLVSCQSYMVDTLFFDDQVTNKEALQRASQKDRDWYDKLFEEGLLTNESIRSSDGFKLHSLNVRSKKTVNIVVLSMHGFGNDEVYQFFKYGRMFYEQMGYNLYEAIKNFHLPLLFIHSEFDSVSPIWMMYELYLAKPEPKEYWKVRFAKHAGIITEYPQEYAERTTQFIQKNTKKGSPLWR